MPALAVLAVLAVLAALRVGLNRRVIGFSPIDWTIPDDD
jgi:hypothetical protein